MTDVEIDGLEGEALVAAVGEALGLLLIPADNPFGDGSWVRPCDDGYEWVHSQTHFRPDRNIDQAWELDGEGWRWFYKEMTPYGGGDTELGVLILPTPNPWQECTGFDVLAWVKVKMVDFPTKATAYATARCRAYLKARAATP